MAKWEQRCFLLVSRVPGTGTPLIHSFHLPEWEALSAKKEAEALPDHLIDGLAVVPAVAHFEIPEPPTVTGDA